MKEKRESSWAEHYLMLVSYHRMCVWPNSHVKTPSDRLGLVAVFEQISCVILRSRL